MASAAQLVWILLVASSGCMAVCVLRLQFEAITPGIMALHVRP